jgi:sialic acid synthase SpsE
VDAAFSLEPAELAQLVDGARAAWEALGEVRFGTGDGQDGSRAFRRSLYVCEDLEAGDVLTRQNLRSIRPGYGLAPKFLDDLLGKPVRKAVRRGTPASWDLVR